MSPETDETFCRKTLLYYCQDGTDKLTVRSCNIIAKDTKFKKFLEYVGTKEPDAFLALLDKIQNKIRRNVTKPDLQIEKKRAALNEHERAEARMAKRARKDDNKTFAEWAFAEKEAAAEFDGQEESPEAQQADFPTQDQGLRRDDLFLNDGEEDDGAEKKADKDAEDKDEDEELDEQGDENGDIGQEKQKGENAAEEDDGDNDEQEEDGHAEHQLPEIPQNYTAYELENGLTRGTPHIRKLFLSLFAKTPTSYTKDGTRILDACLKLKFEPLIGALSRFFRETATMAYPEIRTVRDMKEPRQLRSVLGGINDSQLGPKAHKVFVQMRLWYMIEEKKDEAISAGSLASGEDAYLEMIKREAKAEAGASSPRYCAKIMGEYLEDYKKGDKWIETSRFFGGTVIVFVIIISKIGAGKVDHDWTEFERKCFETVAPHLPSIRKIIDCLSKDALDDFCNNGTLSETKIEELEQLQGLTLDDEDDHGDNEVNDDADDELDWPH